jgi:outer membrane lipoprotein carrier protein
MSRLAPARARLLALRLAWCALALSVAGSGALAAEATPAKPSRAKSKEAGGKAAEASPAAAGQAVALRVQRFYAKTKDFSAAFQQGYTYVALGRVDSKKGRVQVRRPGLLRWEYEFPEKKLLLLDGKDFWQWIPEDNQVIVKRGVKGDELSSAFTFLWGKGDLLTEFNAEATSTPPGLKGDAVLLLPKKVGGSVQRLLLVADEKGRVVASQVTDAQGNENRLAFSDALVDQSLAASLFVFEVPKGAAVQEVP